MSTGPRTMYRARGIALQIFAAQSSHRHVADEEERLQWEGQSDNCKNELALAPPKMVEVRCDLTWEMLTSPK